MKKKILLFTAEILFLFVLLSISLFVARYPTSSINNPHLWEGVEMMRVREYYSLEKPLFPVFLHRVIVDNSYQRRLGIVLNWKELKDTALFSIVSKSISFKFAPSILFRGENLKNLLGSGISNSLYYIIPSILIFLVITSIRPINQPLTRLLKEKPRIPVIINISLPLIIIISITASVSTGRWFVEPIPHIFATLLLLIFIMSHGIYFGAMKKIVGGEGFDLFGTLFLPFYLFFILFLVAIELSLGIPGIFYYLAIAVWWGDYSIIFPTMIYLSILYIIVRPFSMLLNRFWHEGTIRHGGD